MAKVCDVSISSIRIDGVEVTGSGTEKHGSRTTKIFKNQQEMVDTVLNRSKSGVIIECGDPPNLCFEAQHLYKALNEAGGSFVYRKEKHDH